MGTFSVTKAVFLLFPVFRSNLCILRFRWIALIPNYMKMFTSTKAGAVAALAVGFSSECFVAIKIIAADFTRYGF